MSTIISLLQHHAKRIPDQTAYLFLEDSRRENAQITYGELNNQASVIAQYLQNKNLQGQHVLLLYEAGIEFITTFMGCLYAGVIAVPVNCPKLAEFDKSVDFIKKIANNAEIAGVLTTEHYIEKANKLFLTKNFDNKICIIDTTKIMPALAEQYELPFIPSDAIAYLQYTSGSTSTPKAVIIQHKQLLHNIKQTAKSWRLNKKSINLTWAPHTHVYGLVCGLLTPLSQGCLTIILAPDAFIRRPISWLETISHYRVTHSGCPNFGYELCIREVSDEVLVKLDLSSWKVAVNGGENVQYQTLMQFAQKFSPCGFKLNQFCSAYGMSELSGTIAVSRYGKEPVSFNLSTDGKTLNRVFASNGRLLNGIKAVIVDPEFLTLCKKGSIGEIWLTGKSLANGYWKTSSDDNNVFFAKLPGSRQIYFRTGDLGFIKNKEICVTGRIKEIIVRYGKKYYPYDLEASVTEELKKLSIHHACICFSVEINGKEEIIFIQEIDNSHVNISQDIIDRIHYTISKNYGLSLYEVVLSNLNSIPRTISGKLQRKACQQYYLDSQFHAVTQHEDNVQLFNKILASALNIEINMIKLDAPLSEYRLDSISIMRLITQLNDQFRLELSPTIIFDFSTFADLYHTVINQDKIQKQKINSIQPDFSLSRSEPIAIVGMHGLFPQANNTQALWNNLITGRDVVAEVPSDRWDWRQYYDTHTNAAKTNSKWGACLSDIDKFDAAFFNISAREANYMDPQHRLFLETVWHTIEDAGYDPCSLSNQKIGLFVGIEFSDYHTLICSQKNEFHGYVATGNSHTMLANRVSYFLNFTGPSEPIDTACSSSLVAIHRAVNAIQSGDCTAAIVGGVNLMLNPQIFVISTQLGILSPDGRCKTFDKSANGYVKGEGIAAVMLKPLSQAEKDGDHIYGIIKSAAINHGGKSQSLTAPNALAQKELLIDAYKRANCRPETITYIETHGTGTELGDPIEVEGLKLAFDALMDQTDSSILSTRRQAYCGLGAVKTNIGHLEPASGIAGMIKVLLSMKYGKIPGNLHFNEINPFINLKQTPFYLVNETQDWVRLKDQSGIDIPRRAGVNSFGFGGANAHVVLEEAPLRPEHANTQKKPCYLITLSAKLEESLKQKIVDLIAWLDLNENTVDLESLSFTLNIGRSHFNYRCALIVSSMDELKNSLRALTNGVNQKYSLMGAGPTVDYSSPVFFEIYHATLQSLASFASQPLDVYREKLLVIADLYIKHYPIDWDLVHVGEQKKRVVSLPLYPFVKKHYWFDAEFNQDVSIVTAPDITSFSVNYLKNIFANLLNLSPEQIDIDAAYEEYGVDSLMSLDITKRLEDDLGELPKGLIFDMKCIRILGNYLQENYSELLDNIYAKTTNMTMDA